MITVHGMSLSGNCHKVRMLLEHLALPFHWVEVDSVRYGIADSALFAFTDRAAEGGFELGHYPRALVDWLQRVRATERFITMPAPDADVAARFAAS